MSTPDFRPRVSPKIAAIAVSALVGVTAIAAASTSSFATQGPSEAFSVLSLERLPQDDTIPDPLPDVPDTAPPVTTTRPVPTTSRPAPSTSRPVPSTTRPVPTAIPTVSPSKSTLPVPTVAPGDDATIQPVPPITTRPVPSTTRPVPTTTRPAPSTSRPVPSTTRPVPTATRPVPTGKPPVQTPGGYVDIISGGQHFTPGYGIRSKNGNFVFGLFNGGQVAAYSYIIKKHYWNLTNIPAGGTKLILQKNGDLQLLNEAGKLLWHTDTAANLGNKLAQLYMNNNGNVEIWHGNELVWQTDTAQK